MTTTINLGLLTAALLFLGMAAAAGFLRLYAPRLLRGWPLAPLALFAVMEALLLMVEGAVLPALPCSLTLTGAVAEVALALFGWGMLRQSGLALSRTVSLSMGAGVTALLLALCHLPDGGARIVAGWLPPVVGGFTAYALYRYDESLTERWETVLYLPLWMMLVGFLLFAIVPPLGMRAPRLYPGGMVAAASLLLGGLLGLSYRQQRHMTLWIGEVERAQIIAADRERISRELHDGVIQSIYAAGLMLEGAKYEMDKHPEQAMAHLDQVTEALDTTIRDIRRYIFDLRGEVSGEELVPSLRRLLQEFEANTYLQTSIKVVNEPAGPLQRERQQHLYQIVREALSNVARHAHANGVALTVIYSDEGVDINLADDGVGMDRIPLHKGYGLRNIRERVRLLDGTMKIESAPGKGVTLHISVPYG